MIPLTRDELQPYRDRLERQTASISVSAAFSAEEREELLAIYRRMIAICDKRLATNI